MQNVSKDLVVKRLNETEEAADCYRSFISPFFSFSSPDRMLKKSKAKGMAKLFVGKSRKE